MGFIGNHFYQGDRVALAKDSRRLLLWVVLKPAAWLDERGVTMSPSSYRDLFLDARSGLLFEALRHGEISAIRYRPAWLGQVVDGYLRVHGDQLYERVKRDTAAQAGQIVDRVVAALGDRQISQASDPVRQLAQAAQLIRHADRLQARRKQPASRQLSLL